MAVQSPPFALQNGSHSAALFRQAAFSAMAEAGTLAAADLAVTAQGTPNMSVIVAAGRAWMPGTQVANVSGGAWNTQAGYFGINDAPATVTIAASNATNPRIDVIYAAVNDAAYSGASNNMVIGVVTGTPAGSPAVPALPNNAIDLAHVAVAANATTIVSGNISATPGLVATALGGITPVTSADALPGLRVGQYRDHPTLGLQRWDGANWSPVANSIVSASSSTVLSSTSTGSEGMLTGAHNLLSGVALTAGRIYEAVYSGKVNTTGAGLVSVRLRAGKNVAPTATSTVVGAFQGYSPASGGPGQISVINAAQPFQVAASDTYQIATFCAISGAALAADDRGHHGITVYDRGPVVGSAIPSI